MMHDADLPYENATHGFDGIDMEGANRRATRRISVTNAVLGGYVWEHRIDFNRAMFNVRCTLDVSTSHPQHRARCAHRLLVTPTHKP